MKINLICFPFAAGNKYSLRFLKTKLPSEIAVHLMEYPGRGARAREPNLRDLNEVVADAFRQVEPLLAAPYAFYGHSMGAQVAHLLTRKVLSEGLAGPRHLFISSTSAPSAEKKKDPCHLMSRSGFLSRVKELGGLPDEVWGNEELLNFFEPILRADFTALETYEHVPRQPLDIPITMMLGNNEKLTASEASLWQKETIHPLNMTVMNGNHFFLFENEQRIVELITAALNPVVVHGNIS